jgi:hypothetical protein
LFVFLFFYRVFSRGRSFSKPKTSSRHLVKFFKSTKVDFKSASQYNCNYYGLKVIRWNSIWCRYLQGRIMMHFSLSTQMTQSLSSRSRSTSRNSMSSTLSVLSRRSKKNKKKHGWITQSFSSHSCSTSRNNISSTLAVLS